MKTITSMFLLVSIVTIVGIIIILFPTDTPFYQERYDKLSVLESRTQKGNLNNIGSAIKGNLAEHDEYTDTHYSGTDSHWYVTDTHSGPTVEHKIDSEMHWETTVTHYYSTKVHDEETGWWE